MIKAIVTDIEGTTTSLSFVKDVLFPYAKKYIKPFITKHHHNPQIATLLKEVQQQVGVTLPQDKLVHQLITWIEEDKKLTPLKTLQGFIWEEGYRNGDFTGHVYEDVVRNLKKWHHQNIRLNVFSSGSVNAQKLLFSHTEYGDLTPLFSGYFDTAIGSKYDPTAYQKIGESLRLNANEILFLSDIKGELDAAHTAGMDTLWLMRDTDLTTGTAIEHKQIANFDEVRIQ